MAFTKQKHSRKWNDEAARCERKFELIGFLKSAGTVEARKALKAMQEIRMPGPKQAGPGLAWNPKGKPVARGSSGKCERINRGHRAKLNQGKGI